MNEEREVKLRLPRRLADELLLVSIRASVSIDQAVAVLLAAAIQEEPKNDGT